MAGRIRSRLDQSTKVGPVSTMRPHGVETHHLSMRFPQQQGWRALFKRELGKAALRDVNLTIPAGEIFGLLGPNGAGKTTLVKILSTLTIPTEGQAIVTGLDVVKNSRAVRRRIGVVYGDERTFYWRLSGFENLLFYASLYQIPPDVARRRVHELLELVGLKDAAHIRTAHYSSGMKQRASIARGLLNDPDVLIMDEPTRSLDPVAAHDLRLLVKDRIATEGRTVILATNVMAEAEYLCDRVAFINHGEIQMVGEIDDLREILQAGELHQLIITELDPASVESLRALPGLKSLNAVQLDGGRHRLDVVVQPDTAAVPSLVREIVAQGGAVWSCSQRELTLDDMFKIVVKRSGSTDDRKPVAA